MDFNFKGLTLNSIYYSLEDLVDFCLFELISKDLPAWQKEIYGFIVEFISPTEFITQPTSGTTGGVKYIEITKKEMIGSAKLTTQFFGLSPDKNALHCLPMKYIAGKMMVVRAFVSGMNLILTQPLGKPDISSHGTIDFCAMVPLQVSNFLENQENLDPIKTLIVGGSEIDSTLQKKLEDIPTEVYETFGMTETCSHIALRKVNGIDSTNYFVALKRVRLRKDKRGCLVIKAPFLTRKIVTNDMVELVRRNQFKWLGRYDNIINSGGIKIHPETLEQEIEKIIHKEVVVTSEPDNLLGQKVVLVVETGEAEINETQILKVLKQGLPKHLVPKKIIVTTKFPRNNALKIDRKKLITILNLKKT